MDDEDDEGCMKELCGVKEDEEPMCKNCCGDDEEDDEDASQSGSESGSESGTSEQSEAKDSDAESYSDVEEVKVDVGAGKEGAEESEEKPRLARKSSSRRSVKK